MSKKEAERKRRRHQNRRSNTATRLTAQQERFVQSLVKGVNQAEAYRRAYPKSKKWKDASVCSNAHQLSRHPKIVARYKVLMERIQERETEKTLWTREEAISTLKYVIHKNKDDIERIEEAYEDELMLLAEQIEEDPANALIYTREMLEQRKNKRVSQTHNKGITDAVTELNKMQGYNEENINLNNSIVFMDEEELLD